MTPGLPPGVIVITGPTASGKGTLAFELARRLDGEIISLDSMKVYRELDIGTAKPSPERRAQVRYHLIDILEPHESFSTGEYLPLLARAIEDVAARGKLPIVAGGTALYLKGFLCGLQAGPRADWEIRNRLLEEARGSGPEPMHARLQALDPGAAAKIHPRDTRRIVRALEVLESTGRPISKDWAWGAAPVPPAGLRVFGLEWDRAELHARIHVRLENMARAGLFEEAERLRLRSPPLSRSAAQTIGYKEIWEGFDKKLSRDEILEALRQRTRRFAKSQLTWFRKMPIEWLAMGGDPGAGDLVDQLVERLGR